MRLSLQQKRMSQEFRDSAAESSRSHVPTSSTNSNGSHVPTSSTTSNGSHVPTSGTTSNGSRVPTGGYGRTLTSSTSNGAPTTTGDYGEIKHSPSLIHALGSLTRDEEPASPSLTTPRRLVVSASQAAEPLRRPPSSSQPREAPSDPRSHDVATRTPIGQQSSIDRLTPPRQTTSQTCRTARAEWKLPPQPLTTPQTPLPLQSSSYPPEGHDPASAIVEPPLHEPLEPLFNSNLTSKVTYTSKVILKFRIIKNNNK